MTTLSIIAAIAVALWAANRLHTKIWRINRRREKFGTNSGGRLDVAERMGITRNESATVTALRGFFRNDV